ncbi:MAG: outer membrane protein assembly factor BamE [Burkholderiaceae bacterium]|nr:outer membrane protein assembly factor BamE [Burkholderiaceae bacterium]
MARLRTSILLLTAGLALSACQTMSSVGSGISSGVSSVTGWAPTFLGPYRPDVHQGNIITKEMVEQLRPGMTREQVRFMLGTPLLVSEFHKDRWDYAYYLNPRKGAVQNRKLTVFFKDNKLDTFNSDTMPEEVLADVLILGPDARRKPRQAPRQQEKAPEIQTPAPGREPAN